jgi:hypothetical protein
MAKGRQKSPRRDHLRGPLGSSRLVTSAKLNDPPPNIRPPDRVHTVAAMRHSRDLSLPARRREQKLTSLPIGTAQAPQTLATPIAKSAALAGRARDLSQHLGRLYFE